MFPIYLYIHIIYFPLKNDTLCSCLIQPRITEEEENFAIGQTYLSHVYSPDVQGMPDSPSQCKHSKFEEIFA